MLDQVVFLRRCIDCRQVLSLGPSNEEPPEVQIEIEAAAISAPNSHYMQIWSAHAAGFDAARSERDPASSEDTSGPGWWGGWWSGWLAYQIVNHQEQLELPATRDLAPVTDRRTYRLSDDGEPTGAPLVGDWPDGEVDAGVARVAAVLGEQSEREDCEP